MIERGPDVSWAPAMPTRVWDALPVSVRAAIEGVVLLIVGDARAIVAHFAFVNRIADRLGVILETTGAWRSGRHVRRTKFKKTHVRPQATPR